MKKTLCIVAMLLLVVSAFAQAGITEKDLLGKWKISYMDASGMHVDYEKQDITLSREMSGLISAEELKDMKTELFAEMENKPFYGLEYTTGNIMSFTDGDNSEESSYTLYEKNGKQFIQQSTKPEPAEIILTGDKLTIKYESVGVIIIFKKVS